MTARAIRSTIIGFTTLAAIVAADSAVLRTIPSVSSLWTRIGLFGALPMANIVAVCLAIVLVNFLNRRETGLPGMSFLFVGGAAILLLIHVALLAPELFFQFVDLVAGPLQGLLAAQSTQATMLPPLYGFGIGGVNLTQTLLVGIVLTPVLLFPALLAGWATRGYRLKLLKSDEATGDISERSGTRRIRISITCLMALIALVAVDIAMLRNGPRGQNLPPVVWFFGILPMENVMAVYLVTSILRLQKRGDVAPSRLVFLIVGGLAILSLIYVAMLAPYFYYWLMSLPNRARERLLNGSSGPPAAPFAANAGGPQGIMKPIVEIALFLLSIALAFLPLLLPALLASWTTRGYRLKLVKKAEAQAH